MQIRFAFFTLLVITLAVASFTLYQAKTLEGLSTILPEVLGSTSQNTTTYPKDGYSYIQVKTNKGTFYAHVYKASLSKVSVKTVAANKETCKNNCPTKNLKQYVTENNAVAGINGTYFCPPDYSNCKDETNSFDFAFYNSNKKVWLNKGALSWFKTAMATFKDGKAKFCMDTTKCSTSGVSAAVSNYPALVHESKIVVDKGDVQPYQKLKGTKGFIGTDGSNIYLALVPSTTIHEVAYVARAIGTTHALNIDGGGSSAMYVDGYYKVGPGRLLPNAIVVSKK